MNDDELVKAFKNLFDNSKYVPDPISLEGASAYMQRIPLECCPYTDIKKKELWEHGWVTTDIGYFKASEYGEKYDDPKKWPDPNFLDKLKKAYEKYN